MGTGGSRRVLERRRAVRAAAPVAGAAQLADAAPMAASAEPWVVATDTSTSAAPGASIDDGAPGRIVDRPDGLHWIAPDGKQDFGPFETIDELRAYRDAFDEGAPAPAETLQEAESDIGVADWIDPETGEPAEGSCPPRLEEE